MFFSEDYLSETEKVDRIYRMLRSQQRSRRIWFIIKLLVIGSVAYGYYYLSLPAHADIRKQITDGFQARISAMVVPMVGEIVWGVTKEQMNMATGTIRRNRPTNSQLPVKITPEMIKVLQDTLKK